jgi:poly[(R)-3-hydroxyalkanoate] polymerase subunit PhaC
MMDTPHKAPPQSQGRPPRPGPRPLPLHITTAATTWLSCAAALPLLRPSLPTSNGPAAPRPEMSALGGAATMWAWLARLPWHKTLQERADTLRRDLAGIDPDQFAAAVGREVRRRLDELATGLTRYRRHPYRRTLIEAPRLWRDGTTTLRNYAAITGAPEDGLPLLVIPSLINRAYVLDLTVERSFMRFLGGRGFQPFLMDWGRPGPRERKFGLRDYILDRLGTALDRIVERTGRKPALIGYCMGGNLALGLAAARPNDVAGLALLATPWDFHAERADLAHAAAHAMTPWMPVIEALGAMPVDVLQTLFFALDPFLSARKFRAFAAVDGDSAKAREFVALEDWLNDGVPLAAPVARECLLGWYGENTPARGEWRLGGRAVRPEKIEVPSLVVVPEQDRIVPPKSAEALARLLPNVTKLSPPLGHIGMMVGGKAAEAVWEPLARWLDSAVRQRL